MINNAQPVQPTSSIPEVYILKIVFASLCMFLGVFGVFFSIWRHNNYSVGPCLFLEMICVLIINMNAAYKRGKLFEFYTRAKLSFIFAIACIVTALSIFGAIFFVVSGIKDKQDFRIENNGSYFATFPSVLTMMNAIILAFDCRMFIRMFDQQTLNRAF